MAFPAPLRLTPLALFAASLAAALALTALLQLHPIGSAGSGAGISAGYGEIPIAFEENRGQVDRRIHYLARGQGYALGLSSTGIDLALTRGRKRTEFLRSSFVGASPTVPTAGEPGEARVNYLIGRDPRAWQTNVPTSSDVTYRELWPGIDATFYGNARQLEYDLHVAAGADPSQIGFSFDGARRVHINRAGELVLSLAGGGSVKEHRPRSYQLIGGDRVPVSSRWTLDRDGRAGFALGAYDRSRPLVIDPVLSYSTYLGGSGADQGHGIAVDSTGAAYVVGSSVSPNFPTANALQSTSTGTMDAFVSKINPAGDGLVYSTYLGGSNPDQALGVAVDSSGRAHVIGFTDSADFPTANAVQGSNAGSTEAFVTKLDAAGSSLVYSTYLGGSAADRGTGIALGSGGEAYLTGSTASANFPILNPLQAAHAGGTDAYVAKLNADGDALTYSTYLGGSGTDRGLGIAVSASDAAHITGETNSTDFPTANPVQATNGGGVNQDAFVTTVAAGGDALGYSTYLGGTGGEVGSDIALDSGGSAYVTGTTGSATTFPTAHPIQPARSGSQDAFLTKYDPDGDALVYSTYFGGTAVDHAHSIAVDSAGSAYLTGSTGDGLPTANPIQASYGGGGSDGFVAKLSLNPTTTAVACEPPSLEPGKSTGCTATVTDNAPSTQSAPSGTVAFTSDGDGSFAPASCTLAATGANAASCNTTYTPAQVGTGTHKIGASYAGDLNHLASAGQGAIAVKPPESTDADADADADAIADGSDNCPNVANADQRNSDASTPVADGLGDACDPDDDGDGHLDGDDNCPVTYNPGLADADRDGIGTACDPSELSPGRCANPLRGTSAGETLTGTIAGDTLLGLAGDDRLFGGAGDDCLGGNEGNDRLFGGDGEDKLKGHDGNDRLYGEAGDDYLSGGPGSDGIKGGAGTNRYFGRSGDDRIYANNGVAERIDCGSGKDRVRVDAQDTVVSCERVRRSKR